MENMRIRVLVSLLLSGLALLVLSSCGDSDGDALWFDAWESAGQQEYFAKFSWYQKNAEIAVPGTLIRCWPPHTSTQLKIFKQNPGETEPELISASNQCNRGTCPGDKDENGAYILMLVNSDVAHGTLEKLRELESAYQGCGCANEFLQDVLARILAEDSGNDMLAAYADEDCQVILTSVMNDVVGGFLGIWGLNLQDYHVCNNLAKQQTNLWDHYKTTGEVLPCNQNSDTCAGPLWFYDLAAVADQ